MHASFRKWRRAAERAFDHCGDFGMWRGCGPGSHWEPGSQAFEDPLGAGLGVRRPLRFLAHKLDLDERQLAELARILNDLKTDRAQAEVDRRRSLTAFADALVADTFDTAKATEGGTLRVGSAERLRDAVLKALAEIHKILNPEQRVRLAYLIRTGTLTM